MEEQKSSICCQEYQSQVQRLQEENEELRQRLKMDKQFMFMVIHDLKHPTEASINSLHTIQEFFEGLVQDI